MNLNIARWGNSLALRIPADYARRAGIKEGDKVEARLTADGGAQAAWRQFDDVMAKNAKRLKFKLAAF